MRIVVLGRQGSGKGTQGRLLAESLAVPYIGTGDLLRVEADLDTDRGREIREHQAAGLLVPEHIVFELMVRRITSPDAERGFVLDGYPRKPGQEKTLANLIMPYELDIAVYLDVSGDVVRRRLGDRRVCTSALCGAIYSLSEPSADDPLCERCHAPVAQRPDDIGRAVDQRLADFEMLTVPILESYSKAGLLMTVNGEGASAGEVALRIWEALRSRPHAPRTHQPTWSHVTKQVERPS